MTTFRNPTLVLSLALLAAPASAVAQSRADLEELATRLAELRERAVALAPSVAEVTARASALRGLAPELATLDGLRLKGLPSLTAMPREPWDAQDPADSLYREARNALNRGNNGRAAYLFQQIYDRYPRSSYAADAYYWEAYARYRDGSTSNLNAALEALRRQQDRFPTAATRGDGDALTVRIQGELARRGNSRAAEDIQREAARAARDDARRDRERANREAERTARQSRTSCRGEDDERMAALNALLQMDADRALPILAKVMERRDEGSVCLRRKAVFLISQHSGAEAESMLLEAVRSDPDPDVKENAVFWLSQVNSEHATAALDSILKSSSERNVQEKAIFALSQQSSPRAAGALRDFAMRSDAPTSLRENAIFWLGQSGRGENLDFLKTIYRSAGQRSLKEKIIFALAQGDRADGQRWLLDVAGNPQEDLDLRKKALFWLGQSGSSLPELFSLYDKFSERELREQLIFVYSQRHEKEAVDKLIEIARGDRDPELRKKALFWLSQSDDPRVAKLLEDIITKP